MTSKTRIQNYLKDNKISELFEEMMGKLVRDLPASPIYYLVNFLQEKEKIIKKIVREHKIPRKEEKLEISSNAKLWSTAPVSIKKSPCDDKLESIQPDNRKYDKPWLKHSKKSPTKSQSGSKLSQTSPVKSGKMDDVIDGNDEDIDLGLVYATPKIVGESHKKIRTAEEEMESELSVSSGKQEVQTVSEEITFKSKLSAKKAKQKRYEELHRLAEDSQSSLSGRPISPLNDDDDDSDDALEVLENADELLKEGVKNPPKTGVVVGRSGEKEKEHIELVLNMSKFFDELGGMEGLKQSDFNENPSLIADGDDEDFESASQVTGPRRPVWEAPASEVESEASQLQSARMSGIAVDTFVSKSGSGKANELRIAKSPSGSQSGKSKQKDSNQRPHTAPSRPNSKTDIKTSEDSPKKSANTPRSRPTTPRSRPTTPQGSQVGRTSRRVSQGSNVSLSKKVNGKPKNEENVKGSEK